MNPHHTRLAQLLLASAAALALSACGGGGNGAPSPAPAPGPAPVAFQTPTLNFVAPSRSIELANYTQTGRFSLPVGTGANLLAEEASGVTYNRDTDTLFVVGDGGTSITQVNKRGVLIDSMTIAADATQPQGTFLYDPEGIAAIGGGKFVLVEERYRQVNEFTYRANTTLTKADVRTVKLGTTIGNVGIEGLSYDPMTTGYIAVKESGPQGIFQTTVNFSGLAASNGSPTTENSTNLFDPARLGLTALNDVIALANVLPTTAPDYAHLLVLSAPDGRLVQVDRAGNVQGTLNVGATAQNEGATIDADRNIYVVSEVGGGAGRPELLVFSPTVASTAVGIGSNLYLTFNQAVVAGVGNITLSNGAGDTRTIAIGDASQVAISGSTVVINPATDLLAGSTYSITYAASLVRDTLGNPAPAVTSTTALSFRAVGTTDTSAPTLVSSTPTDNATGITSSRILLTFNEPVMAGTGNIVISNGAGDTRTLAVGDATQVTVSGSTVNINPSADLLRGFTYNVQLASGVIRDVSGNAFVGITDATTLNFTTAAAPSTVLVAGDVLFMAANADAVDAFAFVLMKDVVAGTNIGFSDRDYSATTGFPATGEAAYIWTANMAYPAGTIVTIQTDLTTPVADRGTVMGAGGGLSTSAETVFAFQGSIAGLTATSAGAITVDRFLAAINLGNAAGDIPAALTAAGAYMSFAPDNVRYMGSLDRTNLVAFRALVTNAANWAVNDTTAFPLTSNSLFP